MGGEAGPGHYRAYVKYREQKGSKFEGGQPYIDARRHAQAGFRSDWRLGRDELTVQGDAYSGSGKDPGSLVGLQLGRHELVVGELTHLTAELPLHEGFRELLAIALYRSGRQAEALRAIDDLRRQLVDNLGVDPGHRIRELDAQMAARRTWPGNALIEWDVRQVVVSRL